MEKNDGTAAVREAERIMSENPFLEITVKPSSIFTIANHINGYVVRNAELFGYDEYQFETYRSLGKELYFSLTRYGEELTEEASVVLDRSEIKLLEALYENSKGDQNLKRFQFSDAMTDISNAYHIAYKNKMKGESKFSQFIGRIAKGRNE